MPRFILLLPLAVLATTGGILPAQAQIARVPDSDAERVVVTTGGEYVSYPPAKTLKHAGGVTEYEIDMQTAITDRLRAGEDRSVSMTWRANDSTQALCFKHQQESRCRSLQLPLDSGIEPRFKPTLIDRWPTIYVYFTDTSGQWLLVEYSGGEIRTMSESMSRYRVAPN